MRQSAIVFVSILGMAFSSCKDLGVSLEESRTGLLTSTTWRYKEYARNGVRYDRSGESIRFYEEGYYNALPGPNRGFGTWRLGDNGDRILFNADTRAASSAEIITLTEQLFSIRGTEPGPDDAPVPFSAVLVPDTSASF